MGLAGRVCFSGRDEPVDKELFQRGRIRESFRF